jgi:hypothetical protein
MARRLWIPCAPPLVVLLVGALGQWKEQFALLAVVASVPALLWTAGLAFAIVVQLVRKAPWEPLLVGLLVALAGLVASFAIVAYPPLWAQEAAGPAIDAIEASRADTGKYPEVGSLEGDFPAELRPTLLAGGHCLYKPRPPAYVITCVGRLPFARYRYDAASKRWSAWD